MSLKTKLLAAGAAAGALLALSAPASAATVIVNSGVLPTPPVPGATTPFSLGGSIFKPSNTYFFAFKLTQAADWQSQIAINYTLKTTKKPPAPQPPTGSQSAPLSYSLFKGTCSATTCTPIGAALDSTLGGENVLGDTLGAGNYFLKLTSVTLPALKPGWSYKLGPSLTGSYTTAAVPEPAAWSLMILGMGGMGAALRGRRRGALASA